MAAGAMATVPPPPGGPTAPAPPPPKSGADASPAPPSASPQSEQASRAVIQVVQTLRKLAQDIPATAPAISKINDLMREVQLKVMASGKPPEPSAPPVPAG